VTGLRERYLRLGGGGKVEEERGPFASRALDGDPAFVALNDLAHDEEAQAGTLPRGVDVVPRLW